MILLDVNILIYAHRLELPQHAVCREWLENRLATEEVMGAPDTTLSGFLRIVTNPKVFKPPTSLTDALAFTERFRSNPNWIVAMPGDRQWRHFTELCERSSATGKLVADAYMASFALALDAMWASTDNDFKRFAGVRIINPLHERKTPDGAGG